MIRISDVMLKFGGALQQTAPNPNDSNILIRPEAFLFVPQRAPIAIVHTVPPGQTLANAPVHNDSFSSNGADSRANQAQNYTYMFTLGVGLWQIDWFVYFTNNATAADNECGAFRIENVDPHGAGSIQANLIAKNAGLAQAHQQNLEGNFTICSNNNIAFSFTSSAAAVGATAATNVLIQGHKLI